MDLWLDETSDAEEPRWVVSLDDEDGTSTIAHYAEAEYPRALTRARQEADRRGLPLREM